MKTEVGRGTDRESLPAGGRLPAVAAWQREPDQAATAQRAAACGGARDACWGGCCAPPEGSDSDGADPVRGAGQHRSEGHRDGSEASPITNRKGRRPSNAPEVAARPRSIWLPQILGAAGQADLLPDRRLAYDHMVAIKLPDLNDDCQSWRVKKLVMLPGRLTRWARQWVAQVLVRGAWLNWWQRWAQRVRPVHGWPWQPAEAARHRPASHKHLPARSTARAETGRITSMERDSRDEKTCPSRPAHPRNNASHHQTLPQRND